MLNQADELPVHFKEPQEPLYNGGRIVEALFPVKSLDYANAVLLKESVPFMVQYGSRVERSVHFQDAPLAIITDEEISFPCNALRTGTEASKTIRKEQDASSVQGTRNSQFAL
jgi:hypothetical protein